MAARQAENEGRPPGLSPAWLLCLALLIAEAVVTDGARVRRAAAASSPTGLGSLLPPQQLPAALLPPPSPQLAPRPSPQQPPRIAGPATQRSHRVTAPRYQQRRPALPKPASAPASCPAAPPVDCRTLPAPRGAASPRNASVLVAVMLPDVPCCSAFDRPAFAQLLTEAALAAGASQQPSIYLQLLATSTSGGSTQDPAALPNCTFAKLVALGGTLVQARVDFDSWRADAAAAACFYRSFLLQEPYINADGLPVVKPAGPAWLQGQYGPTASVASVRRDTPLSVQRQASP